MCQYCTIRALPQMAGESTLAQAAGSEGSSVLWAGSGPWTAILWLETALAARCGRSTHRLLICAGGPFCCWSCGAGGSSGPFCCWVDLESTGARLPASSPCMSDRPAAQAIDRCAARRWCRNQRARRGCGGGSGSRGGGRYSRRGGICSRGGGGRYSRGGGCRGSREGGSRGGG